MPGVDREHTTHYESRWCARAKVERLEARVRELEAALEHVQHWMESWPEHEYDSERGEKPCDLCDDIDRAAAVLKGDAE